MRPFTIIAPTIWTGDTGVGWKERGPYYQLLGHYLAESPMSNQYGLYYLPMGEVVNDVGVDRAHALEVFAFFHDTNYAHYDARTQWVFVVNMWERQFMASGTRAVTRNDKRVLGLIRWYENCPANPFLGAFFDRYGSDFFLPRRRDSGERRVFRGTDGVPTQPPLEQVALSDDQRALCEQWMACYPVERRTGRAAIHAAWAKLDPQPTAATLAEMLTKLDAQKRSEKWRAEGGRFIPGAVRYLDERRFEDDVEPPASDEDDEIRQFKERMRDRD